MVYCMAIFGAIALIAGAGGIDSSAPALLLKGFIILFFVELTFAALSNRQKPKV